MSIYSEFRFACFVALTMMIVTFTSCNDDDKDEPIVQKKETYVLLTTTHPMKPGYMTAHEKLSGEIPTNVQKNSLSTSGLGFSYYGKYIFQRVRKNQSSPTSGLQRYSIDKTGKMIKDLFLASGQSNTTYIYNDELGFYCDDERGLLKIQTFNPTNMQRTGEIDLSTIKNNKFEYQSVGESLIVAKGNKLYVNVTYGSKKGKGSFMLGDPALGFTDLAVIDIPSLKFEKVIRTEKVSYLGYPGNHNQMWTLGDDGALYLCSHGLSLKNGGSAENSAIVRIKKNETEFDKTFIIKADDYTAGATLGVVAVKNGKLYTAISNTPFTFQGTLTADNYYYYEFDLKSGAKGKKIEVLPNTQYSYVNGQTIVSIKNELYFNVVNNSGLNGYYKLNGDKFEKVFNVKEGGRVMGFGYLTE